jgi:hypothetical protein
MVPYVAPTAMRYASSGTSRYLVIRVARGIKPNDVR